MLRTYRIVFPKNWVCQPSKWNEFFTNLALDIQDINTEMESQTFDLTTIFTADETIIKEVGKNG